MGAACGYNAVSVAGWNALDTYSAEIVPTAVRTTAIGLMAAVGRFGAIFVRQSLWSPRELPARQCVICGREARVHQLSARPANLTQAQLSNAKLVHVSQWGPLIPGITVMMLVRRQLTTPRPGRPSAMLSHRSSTAHPRSSSPNTRLSSAAPLRSQAAVAVVTLLPEETQGRPLQDMAGEDGDAGQRNHKARLG